MATSKAESTVLVDFVAPRATTIGWDPYEVWRSQVLLPRLAEQAASVDVKVEIADVARDASALDPLIA